MELEKSGKNELLDLVMYISGMVDIHYIRQKDSRGLGHAIYCAKTFVGDEPFAILLGDDVVYNEEKPSVEEAPSNVAILGRYIVTPRIFDILENTKPGKGGEIQLTDALLELMGQEAMYAYDFEGRRYDVGDKLGFLEATVEYALRRPELREGFIEYLNDLSEKDSLFRKDFKKDIITV